MASLRYDKRTYTYASTYTEEQINAMTVQEEVIDDALLAVETLAKTPGIDADAIVLVGHSLGGMLAPRIAAQSGKVAGIVSLQVQREDTWTLSTDQNMAQTDDASQQNVIKKEYKKIDKLKNMKDSDTLFGIPVPYLKDLYAHPVEESLAQLDIPILVMQGENDFQMDTADYKFLAEGAGELCGGEGICALAGAESSFCPGYRFQAAGGRSRNIYRRGMSIRL